MKSVEPACTWRFLAGLHSSVGPSFVSYIAGIIKIAHLSGKSVGVPLADPVSPTPCVMTTEMAKEETEKKKKNRNSEE